LTKTERTPDGGRPFFESLWRVSPSSASEQAHSNADDILLCRSGSRPTIGQKQRKTLVRDNKKNFNERLMGD
jgi:hypothetical protein